jgi:hypothetical protein
MFKVDSVPEEYINEAKKVDGDDYVPGCMVIHAYHDRKEEPVTTYCLLYITSNGDDLEWECELSAEDEAKMFKLIREELY